MNVLFTEHDYHNVGINMFVKVEKAEFQFQTTEPHKNTEWRWVAWSEFLTYQPKFIPFQYFFEQGYESLDKIKAKVGLEQEVLMFN